jgi:hypothetical protein
MSADDVDREGDPPSPRLRRTEAPACPPELQRRGAEPQPRPRLSGRACRLSPRRRWLPCIPCHVFSALFFVLVLVVLWFALRG